MDHLQYVFAVFAVFSAFCFFKMCYTEENKVPTGLELTWEWVNGGRIFIFRWTFPISQVKIFALVSWKPLMATRDGGPGASRSGS